MKSLESLDLSHNNLSGTIYPSLSNLEKAFLSKFSVAFNKLVGRIPLEAGFDFSKGQAMKEMLVSITNTLTLAHHSRILQILKFLHHPARQREIEGSSLVWQLELDDDFH
ncbi:hypothetical protein IFM89_001234 [Coptis chinensis]|uniref:Uncharacterized protein n=1 Tax=Coptis chinensis TaxID=261450 RepID=A0A835LGK3_9MAGN|nr:hypothetical protein IFM89_001234 [Coptis chinensis]